MNRHIAMGCLYSIFVLMVTNLSYAQAPYDISVTINGTNISYQPCGGTTTSQTCTGISGIFGNIEIAPVSAAALARVEIPPTTSDGSSDTLRLVNAKIISRSGTQTPTIIFKRQFKKLPDGNAVNHKLTMGGWFTPENGNTITAKGFYTNPPSGTPNQIGSNVVITVICGASGCSQNSAPSPTTEHYNPGTTDRILEARLTLTLKQTGSTFNSSSVKLEAPSQGDGDNGHTEPSVCPECTPKAELGLFCQMTYSTGKAFNCPSCVTEDGQVAQHAKVKLFASTIWDHLVQDMAKGRGEHLASLAALFHIPFAQQQQFYALAQETYFDRPDGSYLLPDEFLMSLQNKWRAKSTVALIK